MQILDAPVPQGGTQLVEAFRHLDLHVPEQLIEVPKISSPGSLGADGGTVGGSAGIRAVGCSVMVRTCWSEMVAAIVTTTKTNGGKHREGCLVMNILMD